MLTTPTSALYMESFSDAATGKVKAAEREAEKNKKKEKEDKKNEKKMNKERTPPLATPTASRPRRPSDAVPQRALRACRSALARRC